MEAALHALTFQAHTIRDKGDMLCLTDMWKAGGEGNRHRNPTEWARYEGSDFLEKNGFNTGDTRIWKSARGKGGGVWAHWQIGMAYAQYLSPELHAWCNQIVRDYMEGKLAPSPKSAREMARENGKPIRSTFTSTLAEHGVRGRGFAQCTDAVYVGLFGKPAKRLKQDAGLKSKGDSLRDNMNHVQLMSVGLAEALASEQIEQEHAWGNDECADASAMAARSVHHAVTTNRAQRKVIGGAA